MFFILLIYSHTVGITEETDKKIISTKSQRHSVFLLDSILNDCGLKDKKAKCKTNVIVIKYDSR